MVERTAALIQWGRYYRGIGLEREIPFTEAATEYCRRIQTGQIDETTAREAAEFFFFCEDYERLRTLEESLLEPHCSHPDIFALCGYARHARGNTAKALQLLRQGCETFPESRILTKDLRRIQTLTDPMATYPAESSEEVEIESFEDLYGTLYLLLFFLDQGMIQQLPSEIEDSFRVLSFVATAGIQQRDALLARLDYETESEADAGNTSRTIETMQRGLDLFPEDYEILHRAALFVPKKDFRLDGHAVSPLVLAEKALAIRPWLPDAYRLTAAVSATTAEESLNRGEEENAIGELERSVAALETGSNLDLSDRKISEELLLAYSSLFSIVNDPIRMESIRTRVGALAKAWMVKGNYEAWYIAGLGRSLFENGLEEEGESLIRRSALIDPDHPAVRHALGVADFSRGMRQAADQSELIESAADHFRAAFEVEENPLVKGRYLVILASVYRQLQDDEEELAVLLEGMRLELPDEEIYLTVSELYHATGNIPKAVEALELGTRILPMSSDLGIETARCYSRDGHFEDAVTIVDRLLEAFPSVPWIWNQMGIINIEWGGSLADEDEEQVTRYRKAADAYDQARRLSPEEFTYRGNYGDALRLLGDLDRAEEHLKASLALNPEDIFSLNSLGLLYGDRAKAWTEKEDQERWLMEAEHCFNRAADIDPSNSAFEINLADLYYDFGYFEDTIDIYQRIIETVEDAWQYYDIIGLCYYHTGNLTEATRWFRAAMAKEPQAPEVVNSLGLCYFGAGKITEAIEFFKQASLLDPANSVYLDNIVMAQYNQKGYSADYNDGPRM